MDRAHLVQPNTLTSLTPTIYDWVEVMSFKSVQNRIAKRDGVSKKAAGAILANASRNASAAAKRKNPKLRKVK